MQRQRLRQQQHGRHPTKEDNDDDDHLQQHPQQGTIHIIHSSHHPCCDPIAITTIVNWTHLIVTKTIRIHHHYHQFQFHHPTLLFRHSLLSATCRMPMAICRPGKPGCPRCNPSFNRRPPWSPRAITNWNAMPTIFKSFKRTSTTFVRPTTKRHRPRIIIVGPRWFRCRNACTVRIRRKNCGVCTKVAIRITTIGRDWSISSF